MAAIGIDRKFLLITLGTWQSVHYYFIVLDGRRASPRHLVTSAEKQQRREVSSLFMQTTTDRSLAGNRDGPSLFSQTVKLRQIARRLTADSR